VTLRPSEFSEAARGLCLLSILLVPFASAGLALINTGLCRSRNAAHTLLGSLVVVGVAAGAYFVCGYSWQGYPGLSSHAVGLGGRSWDWIGAERFLMGGLKFDGSPASLAAWLGMVSVGVAALIPLGAGAERWRLAACAASTALFAGWTYPLFAHWVWGGGWLAGLASVNGLGGGYLDVGGSGTIHAVGGVTALAVAWILGPRRGKYTLDGTPSAMPGHNGVFVLFGCLAAWIGWLGLNSAGAIFFAGGDPGILTLVGVNTTLAASSSGLASLVVTRVRFGKPDASLAANGWVAGLVACSAGCPFFRPGAAVLVGALAGALVVTAVPWFESKLFIDDPGGAVAVHGLGGLWGVMAVGLFGKFPASASGASGGSGQWLAQLVGVATLVGLVLPMTYGLNWLLHRVYPQRVPSEAERQGLDLYELGAGAYPEFMTHTDEFTQK
jgi:ammonium transporter, Amt family